MKIYLTTYQEFGFALWNKKKIRYDLNRHSIRWLEDLKEVDW